MNQPRQLTSPHPLTQVDHVFSDKTGTLTQNIMTLRHFFVNGRIIDENGDGEIAKFAKGDKGEAEDQVAIRHFLRALIVCHSVVPSIDEKTEGSFPLPAPISQSSDLIYLFIMVIALVYEGDSPDEVSLLDGLRASNILFTAKTPKGMTVDFMGETQNFETLKVIEFNSTRKRMSVIVRTPEGNQRVS